jgi:hypothetical protein
VFCFCTGKKKEQRKSSWNSLYSKVSKRNVDEEDEHLDKKIASDRMTEQIKEYGGKEYIGEKPDLEATIKVLKNEDPFNDYGYGFIAYFRLLTTLMKVYFVISAMMWYVMWSHSFGNAIEG